MSLEVCLLAYFRSYQPSNVNYHSRTNKQWVACGGMAVQQTTLRRPPYLPALGRSRTVRHITAPHAAALSSNPSHAPQ